MSGLERTRKKVWAPQPGPQMEAICATWANELFYGGAAGGGKSEFLLGDFLQDVFVYEAAWQGVIFRRTYPELEQLMSRAHELYPATGAQWNEQKKTYSWFNGAALKFRYLERELDRTRHQGSEYTWVGWDELTQWPTDRAYRYLRGRLRSGKADVPTKRIRAAANPGGVGHHWVKSYFVSPAPGGYEVLHDNVTDMARMFVPARLADNAILMQHDPGYAARLRGLGSEALVKAWLEGDWNIVEGAFFDCWSDKMVVPPCELPSEWLRFRSADWGSASPFSIGWWAIVQDDWRHPRTKQVLPRGAMVRYREWYGSKDPAADGARGLKLMADQVGRGIVEREKNDPELSYGVLDPSTFRQDGGPPIAEVLNMELIRANLVPFHEADNTRVARNSSKDRRGPMSGWDQMRARMVGKLTEAGEARGKPMVYCFSTCVASIRTIPVLQHDTEAPEDLDTNSEDHCFVGETLVATADGPCRIDSLPPNGIVWDAAGQPQSYRNPRLIRRNTRVVRLTFGDGSKVVCTPDHRFKTADGCWIEAQNMLNERSYASIMPAWMGQSSLAKQSRNFSEFATINAELISNDMDKGCIVSSGAHSMAPFRAARISITKTAIIAIIRRKIWNASKLLHIWPTMAVCAQASLQFLWLSTLDRVLHNGTPRKRGAIGTPDIGGRILDLRWSAAAAGNASIAARYFMGQCDLIVIARTLANLLIVALKRSMISNAAALFVGEHSGLIGTKNRLPVHLNVERLQEARQGLVCLNVDDAGKADVYCLTVPGAGSFHLANGIAVANCADDWRYGCSSRPWLPAKPAPEEPRDGWRDSVDEDFGEDHSTSTSIQVL